MRNYYIGIDNGVTGSIGIVSSDGVADYHKTPVKKVLNYTKDKAWLNRVDTEKLREILKPYADKSRNSLVILERPMINPSRWTASVSAMRALEATLIVIEELGLPYLYIDSKQWQSMLLPLNVTGEELKPASKEVANRLFPKLQFKTDGDGILIAEWARRKQL